METKRKRGRPPAISTIVEELKNSLTYQNVKNDLLNQLEVKGIKARFYTDLVEDYMHLWITKSLLIADIEKRGVSVKWVNGQKQSGYKKNDSINELNKTNTQMLKILEQLDIKPSEAAGDDDEL